MSTSEDIKKRALELSEKTDSNSISPKEVGGIMHDLASLGENALRNGGTLGIRKVYASIAEMEADKNPKDLWGNPLKKGNLVVIYDGTTTGTDNNKVYAYMNPGWQFATYLDAGYATRSELSELASKVFNNSIEGKGSTYSRSYIKGLIPNRSYKVNVNLNAWDYLSVDSSDIFLSIYAIMNDGSERALLRVRKEDVPTLAKQIEITMPSDSNGNIVIGGRASIGSYIQFTITDETDALELRNKIFSVQKNATVGYWYIQYPFKKGESYTVSNIGSGSAYAYLANTIPGTTEPNPQDINGGKDFKESITFVAENDYSVIRGYCSKSTVLSVGAVNGIESRIQKLETKTTLKALLEKEFVRGNLSESGYANYATYDTIVLKGYYDVSKLGVIEFETSSDIRQRVSFFDKDFKKLSCSSWQNKKKWDVPTNAKYCKVGLRPYENNAVKHSASDIISTNVACEVNSNLIEVVDVSNAKGITSSTFAVAHNTPSVSQLTIVAKAETSATLKITYYTRTKSFVYCSNCNIGDKRETINLLLPPIMYDGNACEIRIEGNCYIEQLNLNPINVQSQDNHIRVSAHLGYRLYFPENTKLSYKMAAMCGMWGSVANVHETADGGLICYHQDDARLSEDGVNIISLTPSEINSKTTSEITSYNAGIYMSPYYTDENVPTFDEYCQIMAQGNMHPILSTNAITDNLYVKIKEVLDKYGLTSKTIIRSYSTAYLQRAYSVFGDSISYCFDAGAFTEDKISSWDSMNFGNAKKMVGYDWMHYGSEDEINEALNSVFSKGMRVIPDAKDNYELFKLLINKGVRDFTVNHFISANML